MGKRIFEGFLNWARFDFATIAPLAVDGAQVHVPHRIDELSMVCCCCEWCWCAWCDVIVDFAIKTCHMPECFLLFHYFWRIIPAIHTDRSKCYVCVHVCVWEHLIFTFGPWWGRNLFHVGFCWLFAAFFVDFLKSPNMILYFSIEFIPLDGKQPAKCSSAHSR